MKDKLVYRASLQKQAAEGGTGASLGCKTHEYRFSKRHISCLLQESNLSIENVKFHPDNEVFQGC